MRENDDDWGQAGTLVRDKMDDAARQRLVANVVGHLKADVTQPVLDRAFDYWRNIDKQIGDCFAKNVGADHGYRIDIDTPMVWHDACFVWVMISFNEVIREREEESCCYVDFLLGLPKRSRTITGRLPHTKINTRCV